MHIVGCQRDNSENHWGMTCLVSNFKLNYEDHVGWCLLMEDAFSEVKVSIRLTGRWNKWCGSIHCQSGIHSESFGYVRCMFLLQCMSHPQLNHAWKELHASFTQESSKLHERRFSLKIATKCSNSVQIHILSRISQIYGISDIGNMLATCCRNVARICKMHVIHYNITKLTQLLKIKYSKYRFGVGGVSQKVVSRLEIWVI